MSATPWLADELRRVAAQVRRSAERLERMADNVAAGRAMHDGIGQVVVMPDEGATQSFIDLEVP